MTLKITKKMIAAGLVLAALFFLLLGVREAKAEETVADNVYIENVSLAGMTREEASAAIENKMNELGQGTITVQVGEKTTQITAAEMGLYQTNTEVLDKIMSLGNKGNVWERFKAKKSGNEDEPVIFELKFAVSEDAVRAMVEERCVALNIERQDMKIVKGSDGSFYPTDKTDGLYVDVDSTVTAICQYMNSDWYGGSGTIKAVTTVDEAQGDAETYALVKDVLGEGTTLYDADSAKEAARNTNLAVGASKLNGIVVYPGEEFSAEEYLTPFTTEAGYSEAGAYLDGEVVDDIGGGVCQVSTTLYRAVLEAELKVTERCQHSMVVGYVDPSMDAAVAEGVKDLKFINNTDAPIYIEGYAADGEVHFTIYGHETRDSARSIGFESVVTNEEEAETKITFDSDLEFGQIETESGHNGMDAVAYKIVYMNGEEVSREAIAWSEYEKSDGGYVIGTKGASDSDIAAMEEAAENKDMNTIYQITGYSGDS